MLFLFKKHFLFSALANILENTALFGDILLRLPDITHKVKFKVLKKLSGYVLTSLQA